MFRRKIEYEDEKRPLPVMWTVVIAIAVLTFMVLGTYKLLDVFEQHEIKTQYEYYDVS